MAFKFPSDEWIKELGRQLNASATYQKSAKDWEGDFLFIAEPDATFPKEAYMFLGLLHGKCTGAAMMATKGERKVQFTIRATAAVWRKVIEGKLDPIQGMMTRKLKLEGNMAKILRYPKAAKEIVSCCAKVPTDFGD